MILKRFVRFRPQRRDFRSIRGEIYFRVLRVTVFIIYHVHVMNLRGTLACVTEMNSHDFALIAHERVFQSSFQEYPPKNGDCMEFVILSFCHFVIFSIFRGRLIYNI